MKRISAYLLTIFIISCTGSSKIAGKPWNRQIQTIPGIVECEFYDKGGEGIAYHDADSVNNGSGKLNPANGSFLNEFRMHEGVDISFTKGGGIDDNPYSKVKPLLDQLYVGWTQPGEWINYTIKATETGKYYISLLYTANGNGIIALDLDGREAAGQLKVSSTNNAQDSIAWRQWHHWNRLDSLTEINIKKGIHKLTLHIVENGNMNFDQLGFKKQ